MRLKWRGFKTWYCRRNKRQTRFKACRIFKTNRNCFSFVVYLFFFSFVSAIAFFEHINLVYGTVSEFCTMSGCPDMSGPGLRTYLWFDEKGKKTRVPAPQYIDYVMTFIQKTVSDEAIFPTKYGKYYVPYGRDAFQTRKILTFFYFFIPANEFPSSFESIVRKILRLLFHVLAHLYHCHFREVVLLNLHAQLNCVFAHLTLFNHTFQLIEPKETEILQDLVIALKIHSDVVSIIIYI